MAINIGSVQTFAKVSLDKAQVLKILEEAAEVFGAWQKEEKIGSNNDDWVNMLDECADVIQATCNFLAACGIEDFTSFMEACRARNVKRGRM